MHLNSVIDRRNTTANSRAPPNFTSTLKLWVDIGVAMFLIEIENSEVNTRRQ